MESDLRPGKVDAMRFDHHRRQVIAMGGKRGGCPLGPGAQQGVYREPRCGRQNIREGQRFAAALGLLWQDGVRPRLGKPGGIGQCGTAGQGAQHIDAEPEDGGPQRNRHGDPGRQPSGDACPAPRRVKKDGHAIAVILSASCSCHPTPTRARFRVIKISF